jgi:hypothetical protein
MIIAFISSSEFWTLRIGEQKVKNYKIARDHGLGKYFEIISNLAASPDGMSYLLCAILWIRTVEVIMVEHTTTPNVVRLTRVAKLTSDKTRFLVQYIDKTSAIILGRETIAFINLVRGGPDDDLVPWRIKTRDLTEVWAEGEGGMIRLHNQKGLCGSHQM